MTYHAIMRGQYPITATAADGQAEDSKSLCLERKAQQWRNDSRTRPAYLVTGGTSELTIRADSRSNSAKTISAGRQNWASGGKKVWNKKVHWYRPSGCRLPASRPGVKRGATEEEGPVRGVEGLTNYIQTWNQSSLVPKLA